MVVLNDDPAITAEQFEIIDHFICFVGTSAQYREQQYDCSPNKENDTRCSLRPVKYTLSIQFDRKKYTECYDQQINGQSDEKDNGKVIVKGIQG